MNTQKTYSLLLLFFLFCSCEKLNSNNIVFETKRLEIPQFPEAFNPSIIEYKNGYLLSFRYIPNPTTPLVAGIGIVLLNSQFEIISEPQALDTRSFTHQTLSQAEDARLFEYNGVIYVTYNDNEDEYVYTRKQRREIYLAELIDQEGIISLGRPLKMIHVFKHPKTMWQKNWVPFECDHELYISYSLDPHEVLFVDLEEGCCLPCCVSQPSLDYWDKGSIRGSAPPKLINGEYLGLFHSSTFSKHPGSSKKVWVYYMGAYTFTPHPPFTLSKISPEPILHESFYHEIVNQKQVIFPGGFVQNGNTLFVAYGRNDCEVWIGQIELDHLYENLIPVEMHD